MDDRFGGWFAAVDSVAPVPQVVMWRLHHIGSAFRYLRQVVLAEAPGGAYRSAFAAACDILDGTPMRDMRPVLDYPGFELWLDGSLDLVARRAHVRLAGGATLAHLSALATFAVGVAEQGVSVRVRVDAAGLVQLRATGRVLEFPAGVAGTWVPVHRNPAGGISAGSGHRPRLVELPRTGTGWELNRVDRLLSSRARPDPGAVPDAAVAGAARRAWELAEQVLPHHLAELAALPWVVVPVASDRPVSPARLGRWELPVVPVVPGAPGRGAPCRDAPGRGVAELAAELVVGAAEARVAIAVAHALASAQGHHSRWSRMEAPVRRAVRVLAGEAFWRACTPALTGPARHAAQRRADDLRRARIEAGQALPDLRRLPVEVHDLLAPLYRVGPAPAPRPPARLPAPDGERAARFEAAWRAAGGHLRDRRHSSSPLPATGAGPAARLAGIGDGVPVNLPYAGVDRADGSLDRLGLAGVREPGVLDRVRTTLAATPPTGDPVDHMLRGHVCYITGRMRDAARHYAAAARIVPDSLDFWHDLAFALLHLGRRESRVFRFAPDLLVYAASGVRADAMVARRVAGTAAADLDADPGADLDADPGADEHAADADLTCMVLVMRAVDRAAGLGLV